MKPTRLLDNRVAVLVLITAALVASAGCDRSKASGESPGKASGKFPGFVQVASEGPAVNIFLDPSTIKVQQGVVRFSMLEDLQKGYVIRTASTPDCLKSFQRDIGVQFGRDGTSERAAPGDEQPIDVATVPGLAETMRMACDSGGAGRALAGAAASQAATRALRLEAAAEEDRRRANEQVEEAIQREAAATVYSSQEKLRRQALAEQQRSENEAVRAGIKTRNSRDDAWAKFYRKPPECEEEWTGECANGYAKAQRTFESKYSRGEL